MNEQIFSARARSTLNQGLRLRPEHLERLRVAREQALAKQRKPGLELVPAWASRALGPLGIFGGSNRTLMPLLAALLILVGIQYWMQVQNREDRLSEIDTSSLIDSALLKGDLPIDAYLDSGFQSWLKRSND